MKKTISLIVLLAGIFISNSVNAQVSVSFNIGIQPIWGPVGYDYVDYYYLPDIEAYYYVPQRQFIYQEGGVWITANSLPDRYAGFDLYNAHKVVINSPTPYLHHATYKTQYASFKGKRDQHVIRDSHEARYFEIKEHPEHNKWKAPEGKGGDHNQHKEQDHDQNHGGGHHN